MIIECIKEGFRLANRNYQLVFVRIGVVIINFLSLLFFLGVPVIAAVAYLGFNLANTMDLLPALMDNPLAFLSKYLGLVFIIGISFIFYLIFVSIIILYSLGGTLGVLRNSVLNTQYKFTLASFFREANNIYSRLFWLVLILSLIFLGLFIAIILSGGLAAGFMQGFSWSETTLEVFFRSFFFLSAIIFGIIIFFGWLIFMIYSILSLVIEDKRATDAIRNTFNLLKNKPQAFLFSIVLFLGVIVMNLALFIIMIPLSMLPLIDIVLSIVNVIFQNYLAIVVWSSLAVYYTKATNYPAYSATYDI